MHFWADDGVQRKVAAWCMHATGGPKSMGGCGCWMHTRAVVGSAAVHVNSPGTGPGRTCLKKCAVSMFTPMAAKTMANSVSSSVSCAWASPWACVLSSKGLLHAAGCAAALLACTAELQSGCAAQVLPH